MNHPKITFIYPDFYCFRKETEQYQMLQ
jgi:hypothetical protein